MNPTTASVSSRHGAEDVDEQFEMIELEPVEAVAPETSETTETNDASKARKSPHIVPKIAPPKVVRRYHADDLPEPGTWVVVTTQDGKRKETLQGRVTIAEAARLRLRHGAGWWEIPMSTVLNIATGDDPARRGR
jgi:hypothetical protein